MRHIKVYTEAIEEEIEGAKDYAEKYVEAKVAEKQEQAHKYKEMANDELKHAMYNHEWAVAEINKLSKMYEPPSEMLEKWNKIHREYVEQVAWIKQMLAM